MNHCVKHMASGDKASRPSSDADKPDAGTRSSSRRPRSDKPHQTAACNDQLYNTTIAKTFPPRSLAYPPVATETD